MSQVIPVSKFRSPSNSLYTKGLFFETTDSDKSTAVYSLKNWDHTVGSTTYPSLYRLYMELGDVTEYDFACTYLEGWEHWTNLLKCTWFKPIVSRWREELLLRLQAAALRRIQAEAKSTSKNAFAANRFLVEKGWEPKNVKGRPKKEDILQEAVRQASEDSRIKEDASRIAQLMKR